MTTKVSEKGQVTIPKAIRDKLGLRPGTVVHFEALGGRLVGSKEVSRDAFSRWRGRGRLPDGMNVDEYLARVRDGVEQKR